MLSSVRSAEAAQPAEREIRLGQIESEKVVKLGQIEANTVVMKGRIESMATKTRRVNKKLLVYGDPTAETPGPRSGAPPSPAPLWR